MSAVEEQIQLAERNKDLRARVLDLEREIVRLTTMEQKPSVSRDVHYVAPGSKDGQYPAAHRAAKIVEVYTPAASPAAATYTLQVNAEGIITTVGLVIFNPTGIHWREGVQYDPTGTIPGTWHWPERV